MTRDNAPTSGSSGAPAGANAAPTGLRRLSAYLHLQALFTGRDVVEVWSSAPEPRAWQTLASRGARRVVVVAPSGTQTDAGGGDPRHGIVRATGDACRTGLPIACADVLCALDVEASAISEIVAEARRVLRPEGVLVLGVASRDRPGAIEGASYYEIVDACATRGAQRGFETVRMVGVAPFAGMTLVEYGVKDPEPILDGTLVERGERVEYYLAIAGPARRGDLGYGVVQVPIEAAAQAAGQHRATQAKAAPAVVNRAPVSPAPVVDARFQASERDALVIAELRGALERHAMEMRAREIELAERDAYIVELELDGRRVDALEARVVTAEARRSAAELLERDARRTIAQLEGSLRVAGGDAAGVGPTGVAAPELVALKQKLADAEAQVWKQMKGRSEAEAAAAELREDNMRKLKDARKLASVELMRAMEEATKKAVTLREELERSERDRKAALAELALLKQAPGSSQEPKPVEGASHRRDVARAREEAEAVALAAQSQAARALTEVESARLAAEAAARDAEAKTAELRGRLLGLERARTAAEQERDEARAQLATEQARAVELVARWRAGAALADPRAEPLADPLSLELERAASERGRDLAERERLHAEQGAELVRLRGALIDRERKLATIERDRPPRSEVERQRAEVDAARIRVSELTLELQRRDAAVERAAAAAAHERARAERLVADERQALAERNDTRARAAEVAARVAGLETDRERSHAALAVAEARAHKAENEVKEKRERIRQLKRELEEAERSAEHGAVRGRVLETVRARVHALETAVADEATRVAGLEARVRGAAGG